jgi:signal transduction histidine kinase/ligand-binding sensor domain-containing protein
MLRRTALCIALAVLLHPRHEACAQELPFQLLSVRDGLRSNYITAFAQDASRRMWIGTSDGLSMFDGSVFTTIGADGSLPWGAVVAVQRDRRRGEVVWAATLRGVANIAGGRIIRTHPAPADEWFADLAVLDDGRVLVASATAIHVVTDSGLSRLSLPALASGAARISRDGHGGVWILNVHGLHHHDLATGRTLTVDRRSIRYDGANHMQHDAHGVLYVCGRDSTIMIVDRERVVRVITWPVQPLCLTIDNHGRFWVGTTGGVYACSGVVPDPGTAVRYTRESGLPATSVNMSFQDSENNLWFGTEGRGIARLEDQHVIIFNDIDITGRGLFDGDGHLWLTSTDGLWEYWTDRHHQWHRQLHRRTRAWPDGYPYEIVDDRAGGFLVSFASGAIAQFRIVRAAAGCRPQLHRVIAPARGIPQTDSFTMLVDRQRRLWCNLTGGRVAVITLDASPRIVREFTGMPADIRTMCEDRQGRVWIAGYGGGVTSIDAERLTDAQPRRMPGSDTLRVRALHNDAAGRVWIGTMMRGVYVVDSLQTVHLTMREGLLDNKVFSFAEGTDGTMWIGTQTGICSVGRRGKPILAHQELTDNPVYDCGLRSDGTLYLATRYTLVLYNVPLSSRDTLAPRLVLTRMQAGGRDIDVSHFSDGSHRLVLAADENSCRVEYAAIHMRRPREIRYQYLLVGVDTAWSAPTDERVLTLAALRPGSYTVLLRATNSEGVSTTDPLRLRFTIERPFYLQWWAVLTMLLAGGGVIVLLVRARVLRLLEIERIRARIAADLHDDIGSGLSRIAMLSELLERHIFLLRRDQGGESHHHVPLHDGTEPSASLGDIAAMLHRVGETSRELVDAMSDVVWSIDPRHDTMSQLIRRIRVFGNDLCESRDMRFHLTADDEVAARETGSDLSRTVLLVCKEAITNAVRHSGARHVRLGIARREARLVLTISDDGRGLSPSALERSSGLANMRMRIEKAGGELEIESAPARGTHLRATLPLTR